MRIRTTEGRRSARKPYISATESAQTRFARIVCPYESDQTGPTSFGTAPPSPVDSCTITRGRKKRSPFSTNLPFSKLATCRPDAPIGRPTVKAGAWKASARYDRSVASSAASAVPDGSRILRRSRLSSSAVFFHELGSRKCVKGTSQSASPSRAKSAPIACTIGRPKMAAFRHAASASIGESIPCG